MFKELLVNDLCGKITLQGQLRTIRHTNIQTCLQIFVILMHYFTKFSNFFINNCKLDITLKLGVDSPLGGIRVAWYLSVRVQLASLDIRRLDKSVLLRKIAFECTSLHATEFRKLEK